MNEPQTDAPRTEKAKFRIADSDHYAVHEVVASQLERELAEAREQNAKLRGIAERAIVGMERKLQLPENVTLGIHAELDQLKDSGCPVCTIDQRCWECADDVSEEGAK